MRGLRSPLFVAALLCVSVLLALALIPSQAVGQCARGATQLASGVESLGAGVVILLDVSTSMFGAGSDSQGNPIYSADTDVMDKATAELKAALQGFQYGGITLFAFQGRSSDSDFSEVACAPNGWGLPDPSVKEGAWVAYRFAFPKGAPANLERLWKTLESIRAAIRGSVSRSGVRRGTGTYIGETLRDAVDELQHLFEAEVKRSNGVPFGYMLKVLLVTDSEEMIDPRHEDERRAAWEETSRALKGLREKLGEQLVIDQLYWGDVCPGGQIAESLGSFNYRCIPHEAGQQYATVVPFPSLFRVADNPAINEWVRVPYLFLCSSAAVPAGRIRLSVEDAYLCRTAGTSSALVLDDPAWVRLDTRGLFVGLGLGRGEGPLPQISLPAPTAGEYSQVPLSVFLPSRELSGLVDEVYPQPATFPVAMVVRLRFTFEPESASQGMPVRFSDDLVSVYAYYEEPAIAVDIIKDEASPDSGVLRVTANRAAVDLTMAAGGSRPIVLKYDKTQITFPGLNPGGEIESSRLPGESVHVPFQVVRSTRASGTRRIPVAVQLGDVLTTTATISAYDVTIHPEPGQSSLGLDIGPFAGEGTTLHCPLAVRADRPDSVTLWATLTDSQATGELAFALDEERVRSPVAVGDGGWVMSLRVEYPMGVAALRTLNQASTDLKLQFSATTDDPVLFVTMPSDLLNVDLQYLERRVEVVTSPSPEQGDLAPGDAVGFVDVRCSPDLAADERGVYVTVNPKLLAIEGTGGLREEGDGRYGLFPVGQDETRYTIRISPEVWNCPVVAGAQQTAVEFRCAAESARCGLPSEGERAFAFSVAERPELAPRLDPDPVANPERWRRLRRSQEVATVTYDLTEATSARIELTSAVRIQTGKAEAANSFVVSASEAVPGQFTVSTHGAPYGARGVVEFQAVDAACGLPVAAPSVAEFTIETVWPGILWVGMLVFFGLALAAAVAFFVYAKLEYLELVDALDRLWELERWMVFVAAGICVVAVAMMVAFLAVR